MATLWIVEYETLYRDANRQVMPIGGPILTNQKVTISGSSAQSSALDARTRFVRLIADAAAYWTEGSNPTATNSHVYLPANQVEFFQVTGGNKIASITA